MRGKGRLFCRFGRERLEMCADISARHKIGGAVDTQRARAGRTKQPARYGTALHTRLATKMATKAASMTLGNAEIRGKFAPAGVASAEPGCTPKDSRNESRDREGRARESEFLQPSAGGSDTRPACLPSRHGLEHSGGPSFVSW